MKFSFATVALTLALTATRSAAQGELGSLISQVPLCAQTCVAGAGAASPCVSDLTIACICENLESISADFMACLATAGDPCTDEELAQLGSIGDTLCAAPAPTPEYPTPTPAPTPSASPSPSSNATVTYSTATSPPTATFTGGAAQVAATLGSGFLMAVFAWVL